MVAHGRIHPSGLDGTVHHESLQPDEVRVAIEQVLEGFDSLPLPFPNEEQELLGHAKGGFVKWLAWLVDHCEQILLRHVEISQKETEKGKELVPRSGSAIHQRLLLDEATVNSLDKSSKFLYNLLLTLDGAIEIETSMLFLTDGEDVTWLVREDIIDVFIDDCLSVTMMQSFCIVLAGRLRSFENDRFLFLDPFTCSDNEMSNDLQKTTKYMHSFFDRVQDKLSLILLPDLEWNQWVLIVLQLSTKKYYIINSLTRDYSQQPLYIQLTLNAALNLHLLEKPNYKGRQKATQKFSLRIIERKGTQKKAQSEDNRNNIDSEDNDE